MTNPMTSNRQLGLWMIAVTVLCDAVLVARLPAQDIWEYSPYKVCLWVALDPSIDTSATAGIEFLDATAGQLERTFGAAWKIKIEKAPPAILPLLERGPEQMLIDDFTSDDLVMVLGKDDASTKTLRVLETAVEQLDKIGITKVDRNQLEIDSQTFASEKLVPTILSKTIELFDSYGDLAAAFREKKISGAFIPRAKVAQMADVVRPVASTLPWHTERVLHEQEKLFLVRCRRIDEHYQVSVRELDCSMRIFGPTIVGSTTQWRYLPHVATNSIVRSFSPIARIEEASSKVAQLRCRAGGLSGENNPARIVPGDVLQPILRRDDRRGGAPLLEPIPWTYLGVTKTDGVKLEGNIYSSFNSVLQGKQTSRAQKIALRVRPQIVSTDLKVVVRSNTSEPQSGCQIYQRDLLSQELRLIGYTDWRGTITLTVPDTPGAILPESVRTQRLEARKSAEEAAKIAETQEAEKAKNEEKAAASSQKENGAAEQEDVRAPNDGKSGQAGSSMATGNSSTGNAAKAIKDAGANNATDPELLAASVSLEQPLMLVYVKSGDTILAKLPLVPGLNKVEVAELPSDARRLEAEAILRGFQGEILDLIGLRAILTARAGKLIADAKFNEAEDLVSKVRLLRDYKSMADVLDGIQRRLLDETKEPIPLASKSKIDRMTQSTRDMLQKYLDNDLPRKLERELQAARQSGIEKGSTSGPQSP